MICFLGALNSTSIVCLLFIQLAISLSLSPGVDETIEGAATRGHMCVRVCEREREITVSKMTNASSMLSPFAASDAKLLYYSRRLSRSPHLISSVPVAGEKAQNRKLRGKERNLFGTCSGGLFWTMSFSSTTWNLSPSPNLPFQAFAS